MFSPLKFWLILDLYVSLEGVLEHQYTLPTGIVNMILLVAKLHYFYQLDYG